MSVNNAQLNICQAKGCYTCSSGPAQLAGTGMDLPGGSPSGGGTSWLTVTVPVVPGEVIELDLMILDVTDGIYDSVVLFDNFHWLPTQP